MAKGTGACASRLEQGRAGPDRVGEGRVGGRAWRGELAGQGGSRQGRSCSVVYVVGIV